jgi:hypothetical protein
LNLATAEVKYFFGKGFPFDKREVGTEDAQTCPHGFDAPGS